MLFFSLFASAQNEEDAIRFSRISPFGTARSAAMGGAFGALGGDLSTLSTNPGGIGVFRKSEASFTSMLDFAHAKTGKFDYEKNMYLYDLNCFWIDYFINVFCFDDIFVK